MTGPQAFHTGEISRRNALRLGLKGAALAASPALAAPAICPPDPGSAGQSAVEAAIAAAMSQSSIPSISYALISCGKVFAATVIAACTSWLSPKRSSTSPRIM